MSLVSYYDRLLVDAVIQQSQQEIMIRATSTNQSPMPARAELKEYGTIAEWIKLLESYKSDTKFKWNNLKQLKREGFKLRIDQMAITPELYMASIKLFTNVNFTGTGMISPKLCNDVMEMLVRFLKCLNKLVKDFRSFYDPAKCPAKLMDRLAMRNPKVFTIWQAGWDRNGYSVTIVIENLLACTEVEESRKVAKMTVAIEVLEYMSQLSKIIDIIPRKMNKVELESQPVAQLYKSPRELLYEELVKVLSHRTKLNLTLE